MPGTAAVNLPFTKHPSYKESVPSFHLLMVGSFCRHFGLRADPHLCSQAPCWTECWNSVTFCVWNPFLSGFGAGLPAATMPYLKTMCRSSYQLGNGYCAWQTLHWRLLGYERSLLNSNERFQLDSDYGLLPMNWILSYAALQIVLCHLNFVPTRFVLKPLACLPLENFLSNWLVSHHSCLSGSDWVRGPCSLTVFDAFN